LATTITFLAVEHCHYLASTELYSFVTEALVCEQLAWHCSVEWNG